MKLRRTKMVQFFVPPYRYATYCSSSLADWRLKKTKKKRKKLLACITFVAL